MYRGTLEQAEAARSAYSTPTFFVGAIAFYIKPCNGYVVIGVRGTANIQDVIYDLKCPPVPRAGIGKMEEGFAQASDECIQRLPDAINDYKNGVPIFFGLHSLACPVGRRCAAHLVDLGYRVEGVLCLESPLTGDREFEAWYARHGIPTLYVRHGADGVCVVPPECLGYVYPGSDAETVILSDEGAVLHRQPFEEGWRIVENVLETVRDHSIDRVIPAYGKWLAAA